MSIAALMANLNLAYKSGWNGVRSRRLHAVSAVVGCAFEGLVKRKVFGWVVPKE